MTTLIYTDNTMYSDTALTMGSVILPGQVSKVYYGSTRYGEDCLYGFCGNAHKEIVLARYLTDETMDYADFLEQYKSTPIFSKKDREGCDAMIIARDKPMDIITSEHDNLHRYVLTTKLRKGKPTDRNSFYAIGSGAYFAVGALAAGASPEKAIEIASVFDSGTNNEVEKLGFDDV